MSAWEVALNLAALGGLALVLFELRRLRRRSSNSSARRERIGELEELLSTIVDPLIVVDRDGNCLEEFQAASPSCVRGILARLSESDGAALSAELHQAIDGRQKRQHRFELDDRSLIADILPLRASADRPAAAAISLRDVTDQERTVHKADKLAARNQAILRSAMDGFFVVDDGYRFQEVNEAFCHMVGYSTAELLRMKITDLEVTEPAQHPADSSPLRSGLHHFATAHRHKDGHVIRLETSIIVLRDGGRKILVGFARDVTERFRAEEALERLSRQNQLILDSAAEGIYGVDTDGRLTFVNPAAARMLGWDGRDVSGRLIHDLLRPARSDGAAYAREDCPVCKTLRENTVEHGMDDVFFRKDGTSLPVEFVSSPIRERSKLTGAVVVFRDISERKQAEEERRQLEVRFQQAQKLESLGVLAGGLAHDFNNLLLSVVCNASLAAERLPAKSELRAHLDKIVKAGRRASELTRQMLAYSGHTTYDVQPLALNELVDEVADFMRAAVPKTVTLSVQLAPDLPTIQADSTQLQQVIMNLLINASEAIGDEAGTVTLETSLCRLSAEQIGPDFVGHELTPGDYVSLEVRDTGCGMSPDVMARVFDPFFSTRSTGRGLGLSALLGIVRSHSGAIRVVSHEGRGSEFTVVFPASAGRVRRLQPPREVHSVLSAGSTVLVVDDEEDIREVVQAVLESRGLRVLTAEDGPAGIERFRQHADEIDVVLLDMTMPGMSGAAVFQEILAIRPDARVILSSGYSEQEALERLDVGRIAGFVHKPYTAQMLVDTIGASLGGRPESPAPRLAAGREAAQPRADVCSHDRAPGALG